MLSHEAVTVDHHIDGKVIVGKDQGRCGSCWAFAANSALESAIAIKYNRAPVRLSEQYLVDCSTRNYGCEGGWEREAWKFMISNGARLDSDYPYTARDESCKSSSTPRKDVIGSWQWIRSVDQMLERVKIQPIAMGMKASNNEFMFYKSGVIRYDQCQKGQINHAVAVVGYTLGDDGFGDDDDVEEEEVCKVTQWYHTCEKVQKRRLADEKGLKNYFKILNSWGSWWGDGGFARFEISSDWSSGGVCGMYLDAKYPIAS